MSGFDEGEACLWRREAVRFDRMLEAYGQRLLAAANLVAGDVVLDVGCGAGATTLAAAAAVQPGGRAVGVDLNPELLDLAASRGEGGVGVDWVCGDAATVAYGSSFDAVISRFGMMLFAEPLAAFGHILGSLRMDGAVTYVTWTRPAENEWHALPFRAIGLPVPEADIGPFALADSDRNVALLRASGCADVAVETIRDDVWVANDVEDAVAFLELSLRHRIPDDHDRQRVLDAARLRFAEFLTRDGVRLPSVALLCRATRTEARQ